MFWPDSNSVMVKGYRSRIRTLPPSACWHTDSNKPGQFRPRRFSGSKVSIDRSCRSWNFSAQPIKLSHVPCDPSTDPDKIIDIVGPDLWGRRGQDGLVSLNADHSIRCGSDPWCWCCAARAWRRGVAVVRQTGLLPILPVDFIPCRLGMFTPTWVLTLCRRQHRCVACMDPSTCTRTGHARTVSGLTRVDAKKRVYNTALPLTKLCTFCLSLSPSSARGVTFARMVLSWPAAACLLSSYYYHYLVAVVVSYLVHSSRIVV